MHPDKPVCTKPLQQGLLHASKEYKTVFCKCWFPAGVGEFR